MKKHTIVILLTLAVTAVITSCGREVEPMPELSDSGSASKSTPETAFTSFILKAENNPSLTRDWECRIEDSEIHIFCPEIENASAVVPSFDGTFSKVYADGREQVSGKSVVNFKDVVYYHLEDSNGRVKTYAVYLRVSNGLPQIFIDTKGAAITSHEDYVRCEVQFENIPRSGSFHSAGKIRLRGNATSGFPKKPFKLKFSSKISPLGLPEAKDWALLAEYSDKSLLRNTWMFEVSKAVKPEYTPAYCHVEVFLNGKYNGVYLLADHIEKSKNRINVKSDGFIVQNNNALSDELFYFRTDLKKYAYTFKYPDPDDGEIVQYDDKYNFIVDKFNHLESVLYSEQISDPETGYKSLIDPVSWAKWYIIEEAILNYEPNIYFIFKTADAKIQMYPAWDGDWSMGLAYRPAATGSWTRYPEGKPVPDDVFWSRGKYFEPLFAQADFVAVVKDEWAKFKTTIPKLKAQMREYVDYLYYAQQDNFERWPILNKDTHIGVALIAFDTWEEEVEYTFEVFDKRIETIDTFLGTLNP